MILKTDVAALHYCCDIWFIDHSLRMMAEKITCY